MSVRSYFVSGRARLWAALFAGLLLVGLYFGGAQSFAVNLIPSPWNKFGHAAVFSLLAAAAGLASGRRGWRLAAVALVVVLLAGGINELHQARLQGHSAGWDDFAADAVGGLLGAFSALNLRACAARRAERRP